MLIKPLFNLFSFHKTFFFLFIIYLSSISLSAQKTINKNNKSSISLEQIIKKESGDYMITSEHISSISGIRHVYLQQAINGLGVKGTESSIHIDKNGKTLVAHNKFITDINSLVVNNSSSLTAEDAIISVAQKKDYTISSITRKENIGGVNQKTIFNNCGISRTDIPVELIYQLTEERKIILTWRLSIDVIHDQDYYWHFQVDANSGAIINKHNLVEKCNLLGDNHSHGPFINSVNESSRKKTIIKEKATNFLGSYNVYPWPVESPNHGARTLVTNPHQDGIGSPFGWHDTDGIMGPETTVTTGNNVDAFGYTTGNRAIGGTALDFNFSLNLTQPALSQENAAITNLFYWNNILHDVTYEYGFDEASGNFQENNYGNGGTGGDSVIARGQITGNCNPSFTTLSDGNNPIMQMFICPRTVGDRDNAFSNGIIAHEYAHGVSNRLTGGPTNSYALTGLEAMNEGWSDFFSLIFTMKQSDLGTDSRAMGTWFLGQTISGAGVRLQPYDTDDNTFTYDNIKNYTSTHDVGAVWAMMLWEMTWNLIGVHGFDPDLYNGTGGNNIALALVIEGMKLQPTTPGFVDGRDAILAADDALYGGANRCTIWDAFAKRGLGASAIQGSSNDRTDGTEAFDIPVGISGFTFIADFDEVCVINQVQTNLSGGFPVGGVYSGPGVTDDGNGTTYSFDPSVAGIGTKTIVYTLEDCYNTIFNISDTIEVTYGIPTVTCQDATLFLDSNGTAVYETIAPNDLVLVGSNNEIFFGWLPNDNEGTNSLQVTVFEDVTLSFDWFFSTLDAFGADTFGYTLNGVYTVLSNSGTYSGATATYNGSFSIGLVSGDVFGFTAYTIDNTYGASTTTISNMSTGFTGQFASSNWTEVHNNSDGTATFANYTSTIGITDTCGNTLTPIISKTVFTCKDVGVNNVTISVDNGFGGIDTCNATVNVIAKPTTYSGTWDHGLPDLGKKVIINADYDTASLGNFCACSLTVNNGFVLQIDPQDYIEINSNTTIYGELLVKDKGSFVQKNDASLFLLQGNGTATVEKMTAPSLSNTEVTYFGIPIKNVTAGDMFLNNPAVSNYKYWFNTANFQDSCYETFNNNICIPGGGVNYDGIDDNGNAWTYADNNFVIEPGVGIITRANTNVPAQFSFTGAFNNGEINVPITRNDLEIGDANPILIGNPYPSAIDADAFLERNMKNHPLGTNTDGIIDGLIYIWSHHTAANSSANGNQQLNFDTSDYAMINLTGEIEGGDAIVPNRFIPSAQGFFVNYSDDVSSPNGNIVFNNAMRVTQNNNQFFRTSGTSENKIWLDLSSETGVHGEVLLGYVAGATDSFDGVAFDAFENAPLEQNAILYFNIPGANKKFVIQGKAPSDININEVVSVGFFNSIQETTTFTIKIDKTQGTFFNNSTVYLRDNLLNICHNLSSSNYNFTSNIGEFNNRFDLLFENCNTLNVSENEVKNIKVYPNPTKEIINIESKNSIVSLKLYNSLGQLILQNKNSNYLNVSKISDGLYLLNIKDASGNIKNVRIVKEENNKE